MKQPKKHKPWVAVVPHSGWDWVRGYNTREMAQAVVDRWERRFTCHPATGQPWGGKPAYIRPNVIA